MHGHTHRLVAEAGLIPHFSPNTATSLGLRQETRVNRDPSAGSAATFLCLWESVETPSVESLEKLDGALESRQWGQPALEGPGWMTSHRRSFHLSFL